MGVERDFKGVWIPKEIYLDTELNALEKIIFAEIDSLSGSKEGCFASNEYLANFCQCSESKITQAISKLKRKGYIKVASFDGRKRYLKSNLRYVVLTANEEFEDDKTETDPFDARNDTDEEWAKVAKAYQDNLGLLPIGMPLQVLIDAYNQMTAPVVIKAIEITAFKNISNPMPYLRKILENWIYRGVKCIEDVEKLDRENKERKIDEQKPKPVLKGWSR